MVTVAIPFSRWGAQPYITRPFLFPIAVVDTMRAATTEPALADDPPPHPIHLALKWRQMLDRDPDLNMAQLARNQNLSRARVTQIMNLLALPKRVQESIVALQDPAEIRFLNERRLRAIALGATSEMQVHRFHDLRKSFRTNSPV